MREALKGVPPQPLPGGTWRPENPPAEVPVARGPDPAGQPSFGVAPNPPQRSAQRPPPQAGQRPRAIDDLLPSGDVGESRAAQNAPREKNFLEKLFGG